MRPSMREGTLHYEVAVKTPLWPRIKQNKMLMVGGIIAILMVFTAIFAQFITKYDPIKMDFGVMLSPPSFKHLMGTDQFGRDILSRIIHGARISVFVGTVSVLIAMIGGLLFGALAGYMGGFVDNFLMRIMDGLLAFPPLLLAVGLVASVGPSMRAVCIIIGVVYAPRFARVMRSSVLVEREKEYVEAARATGQSRLKILLKHIGPNCLSQVIVMGTVVFAAAIIIEASLSFLGVGVPPPTPFGVFSR